MFRNEIKKWHTVLWLVFASLALSGASLIFLRSGRDGGESIATVNGKSVTFSKFRQSYANLQHSLNMLREYARMYGMSEDIFLRSFFGNSNPQEIALNNCIKEALMDNVKDSLNIVMNEGYLHEQIAKTLPKGIVDAQGAVNMDSYQRYLKQLSQTPSEYEEEQAEVVKRKLVERLVNTSYYYPSYVAQNKAISEQSVRDFTVVELDFEDFLNDAKKKDYSEKELKKYYQDNKSLYRIPEKRKARYWQISPKDFAQNVSVSDAAAQLFYNKNKTAMFRNPPQVSVRSILFEVQPGASDEDRKNTLERAQKIHAEIVKKPEAFVDFVRDYSDDERALKAGGLTGLFKKGTHGPDFEKAAFRLQKKGAISGIVKTRRGYEILKLEDRIKATYKPFDSVKESIVKSMTSKRALNGLKSKLSLMLHKARTDKKQIESFASEHKLKANTSDWISASMAGEAGFERVLAGKLFSKGKKHGRKHGYFMHDGSYVIYQEVAREKSFVRKYDDVKDKVKDRYLTMQAKDAMKSAAKKIKTAFFQKNIKLVEAAKEHKNFMLKDIDKNSSIREFKKTKNMKDILARISDKSQILQHQEGRNIFLIQLSNEKAPKNDKNIQSATEKIITNEKTKNSYLQSTAFIASLQRNAKIEVNDKMLKVRRVAR